MKYSHNNWYKKEGQASFFFETSALSWSGEVPPQKWMNFYTRVISKFASDKNLKLKVTIEVSPESGISKQSIEETTIALRELGLNDDINTEESKSE